MAMESQMAMPAGPSPAADQPEIAFRNRHAARVMTTAA